MLNYDHLNLSEATRIQEELSEKIRLEPLPHPIKTVGGAEVVFNKFSTEVYVAIVVMDYPALTLRQEVYVQSETSFPHATGYIPFRKIPVLLEAWKLLPTKPDVLILDGMGITHQRRMGLATHFGILANQPSIGCARSMVHGDFDELELERFSTFPILDNQETIGYALRTKNAVKPLYVSPGHLITADESLEVIKNSIGKYRLPEPIRIAQEKVSLFRSGKISQGLHDFEVNFPEFI